MSKLQLIATSAFGIEAVVGRELVKLGYGDQFVENGKVTFSGDESAICRANIWLRSADRVLLKLGEFKALSFEELFEQTKALPWDEWIPENAEFPVEGKIYRFQIVKCSRLPGYSKKSYCRKTKNEIQEGLV